jgi:hypothetical protein
MIGIKEQHVHIIRLYLCYLMERRLANFGASNPVSEPKFHTPLLYHATHKSRSQLAHEQHHPQALPTARGRVQPTDQRQGAHQLSRTCWSSSSHNVRNLGNFMFNLI